jgi:hypothetical protein
MQLAEAASQEPQARAWATTWNAFKANLEQFFVKLLVAVLIT